MKNKVSDLRNHMFAALERLGDDNLSDEALKKEIEKSKAISEVGKVIVESAKTELLYAKMIRAKDLDPTRFLDAEDDETKKIERPKAIYDNKQHN